MKDFETWKTEIEQSIASKKEKGVRTYYAMSAEMTQQTRDELLRYFSQIYYVVEFRRCPRGLFDVIIKW